MAGCSPQPQTSHSPSMQVLSAILHLSNVAFEEPEGRHDTSVVAPGHATAHPLAVSDPCRYPFGLWLVQIRLIRIPVHTRVHTPALTRP